MIGGLEEIIIKNDYLVKVRWGDTDAAGITFFPNFYKWMDEATDELLNSINLSTADLFYKQKIGWPIIETHCNYYSPAFYQDEIKVMSTVEEVKNKVFKISHQFYRGDTVLASGYLIKAWVTFEHEQPKAIPIPEEARKKLLSYIS